jgi:transcriptional regulator with XRE-family HTH domain
MGKVAGAEGESAPDEVDVQIGALIRECRSERGMSQVALAKILELTFQQIQKYERGINRVSASRLRQLCLIFNKPARFFLPDTLPEPVTNWQALRRPDEMMAGVAEEQADLTDAPAWLSQQETELLANFARITDPNMRAMLLDNAKRLAHSETQTET